MNLYKPNKRPPADITDKNILYDKQAVRIEKGDLLYLFTDGYADQFNGENQKKFSMKRFKDLLLEVSKLLPDQQYDHLNEVFEKWKGQNEQIDDVLVLGITF
jgi:serine phosphatase RsbU (regulator of sigma subunit)